MTTMLATPRTTLKVALYWEIGAPLAENRIIEMKLRFYHHLVHLNTDSVAYKVQESQRRHNIRSLTSECRTYLAQLNISESDLRCYSKFEWEKILGRKIKEKNREDILGKMKGYTKFNFSEKKMRNMK